MDECLVDEQVFGGWTYRWMDGCLVMDGYLVDGWMDVCQQDRLMFGRWMDECVVDKWMNGCLIDVSMADGWMDV